MRLYCLLVLTLTLVSGCAGTGGAGGDKAAVASQAKDRDAAQRCIGGDLDRTGCMQMANARCRAGYEIFEKDATEADGVVRRAYYFKCL